MWRSLLGLFGKTAGTIAAVGGTAAVADLALNEGRTIQGLATTGMGAVQRSAADAGTESAFYNFYKWGEMLAKLFKSFGMEGQWIDNMENWGRAGMAQESGGPSIESPLSEARAGEREFSQDDPTRYNINGAGAAPPSVEYSTEEGNLLNTASLGLKAVKDGVGGFAGGVASIFGGAADLVQQAFGGEKQDWGQLWSRNTAGFVNEATDVVLYDSVRLVTGGAVDWEPTIRSEFDAGMYSVVNTVSTVAASFIIPGSTAAMMGVGGSSVATGGNVLSNIFQTSANGWRGIGSVAPIAKHLPWFNTPAP